MTDTPSDDQPPGPDEEQVPVSPEYRQWLVAAEQKGQGDFDKTVLTLSGGALGVSFAFVKDIVGPDHITHPMLLFGAWTSWALSCFAILASFYVSNLALREAIKQCDEKTIRCKPPGGFYTTLTKVLNACGGTFFLAGVILMAMFVYSNLSTKEAQKWQQQNHRQGRRQNRRPRRVHNQSPTAPHAIIRVVVLGNTVISRHRHRLERNDLHRPT